MYAILSDTEANCLPAAPFPQLVDIKCPATWYFHNIAEVQVSGFNAKSHIYLSLVGETAGLYRSLYLEYEAGDPCSHADKYVTK